MIPISDEPEEQRGRRPVVNVGLVALNVGVFLAGGALGTSAAEYGLRPAGLWSGDPDQLRNLLVSAFLHADLLHLGGNMLYLWVFGDNVEDELGHLGYAAYYLACGLAAGLLEALAFPGSTVPRVGASGAIAGVLAGYLVLFPLATVRAIFPPLLVFALIFGASPLIEVPSLVLLGIWLAGQVAGSLGALAGAASGIAYLAHFGGFLAGYAILQVLRRGFGFAPDASERVDPLAPPVPRPDDLGRGRAILVAARPLPAGHEIGPGDVEPLAWQSILPSGYVEPRDRRRLVGRRLRVPRLRYEAIVLDDLEPGPADFAERASPEGAAGG